jgi:hypothetical protein
MKEERDLFTRVFLVLQRIGRQEIIDLPPAAGALWRGLANRDVTEVELETGLTGDSIDFGARWIPLPLDKSKIWRPVLWLSVNFIKGAASFQVVLMNRHDAEVALGFRFETPSGIEEGGGVGIHHFHHMQLLTEVRAFGPITEIPPWLPTSFPTFPIEAATPVALAFALLLSVYGFGFEKTLLPEADAALQNQLANHYSAMTCVGPLPRNETAKPDSSRLKRQPGRRGRGGRG